MAYLVFPTQVRNFTISIKANRMITKQGSDLEKTAYVDIAGAVGGAARASRLSPEDREILQDEYALGRKAHLPTLNTGRGFMGGMAGGIIGSLAAARLRSGAQTAGLWAGGGLGAYLATNKYSKTGLKRVKEKRQARSERLTRGSTHGTQKVNA